MFNLKGMEQKILVLFIGVVAIIVMAMAYSSITTGTQGPSAGHFTGNTTTNTTNATNATKPAQLPDLVISAINVNATIHKGSSAPISVAVKNIGNATAGGFSVALFDMTVNPNGTLIFKQTVSTLNPTSSVTLYGNLTAAITNRIGSHKLWAMADYNNNTKESNENNNAINAYFNVTG